MDIYQEYMLIKTKFYIPTFRTGLVKRKRLLDRLKQNKNCKVIMITAPAGYGKTALISSYLNHSENKSKVTWITLDNDDNDEELFWSYFLMSFYRSIWIKDEIKQKITTILCNTIPFSRLHLTYFINDIIELGIQIIMVLDNFGVIKNKKIINNLEFLIHHLPSNVQLILLSREYLNIALVKYKALGDILILTGEELSFTQEETISFFRTVKHINLSQEEYIKINYIFEGWITGMQLMEIKDNNKLLASQITENQLIYNYLTEEIINKLDSDTKNFLIKTSILESFCSELCDFLFYTDNSKEIIDRIENLNLFLICIDKEEKLFRYHRLFHNFLQTLVQGSEKQFQLSIYKKTSEWYEAKKCWKEAIDYTIKGKNFNKAVSLIEYLSKEIGHKGEANLLHKWNQYLPKEIVENNLRLLLNSAWAYSSGGNMSKLLWCIKEMRKFETIPVQLQVEITALYSCNLALPQIELDTILIRCKQTLKFLTPKEFLMQLICFNIGAILLLKGSIEESLYYFEKCYINSMESGNFYLAIISKKAIITSQIRNGELQNAEHEILEFLRTLDDTKVEILSAVGLLYAQLAEIYYQRNELLEALNMATKGSTYGELGEDIWTSGENYLILEKIYLAMNDKKNYENTKVKALSCLEGKNFFDLGIKLECHHIQTLILDGKLTLASRKISNLEEIVNPKLNLVYPEFVFLKTKFYMNKENFKMAKEILLSLKQSAKINKQKGLLCEIQVLLSTIYEKTGDSFHALNELEEAILLAQEQRSFQFFLNEGNLMERMLKRLERKGNLKIAQTMFMESLICCFEMQSATYKLPENILSSREIEILNLVAQGAKNEEIADKLFVSKNTVKTHLLNIYTKLGVHSRTKAVSKAEALNIITFH